MNKTSRRGNRQTPVPEPAGVPVGGIGTGCIEFGRDGAFRNVTINNNRTLENRISIASASFLAVRVGAETGPAARILQESSEVEFAKAGIRPPYLTPDAFEWDGLYPRSHYTLNADRFPLDVQWSFLAPILPYDIEASMLPLVIATVEFHNRSSDPTDASAVFNWENLRGCDRTKRPDNRGRIQHIAIDETEKLAFYAQKPAQEARVAPIGLTFGMGAPARGDADGDYCLAAVPAPGVKITSTSWNPADAADVKTFWWNFFDRGVLPDELSRSTSAHCGGVCCSREVMPGERARFVFLLSWNCPKFRWKGIPIGNGYTNEYANSAEVIDYALEHHGYFLQAVDNWHRRFVSSSIPKWLSRLLLNSAHVFSTNSILSSDGNFTLFESPETGRLGVLETAFYTSLGTLLFFPSYAHRELALFSKNDNEIDPATLPREDETQDTRNRPQQNRNRKHVALAAKFIILAYRNFRLTGNLVQLINLQDVLREAAEMMIEADSDQDGLPERGDGEDAGVRSDDAGLSVIAFTAYAYLLRKLKKQTEAERFERLAARASKSFTDRMWVQEKGHYKFSLDPARAASDADDPGLRCHSAQLTGPWAAEFFNLDGLFPRERTRQALETMRSRLYRENGVALVDRPDTADDITHRLSLPFLATVFLACSQVYNGKVDEGLATMRTLYSQVCEGGQKSYNLPLYWDLASNKPFGLGQDRHVGCLAVWHVLYAIEGFFLSVPDQALYIAPNLPQGVDYLSAPIFTPVCLGWLTYQVSRDAKYRQSTKIAFESPIHIRTIDIHVPPNLTEITLYMLCDGDVSHARHVVSQGKYFNSVHIELNTPLLIQDSVAITVVER